MKTAPSPFSKISASSGEELHVLLKYW